jgi:hypothetical protein
VGRHALHVRRRAMSALVWRAFAAELGTMPDVIERLSAIHRPTADGRHCRACTTPGRGTPNTPWPCPIAALIADASHHTSKPRQDRPVAP